ncbi:MAG: hypothetical protein ACFN26_09365, partial [Kingella denitrificans]
TVEVMQHLGDSVTRCIGQSYGFGVQAAFAAGKRSFCEAKTPILAALPPCRTHGQTVDFYFF